MAHYHRPQPAPPLNFGAAYWAVPAPPVGVQPTLPEATNTELYVLKLKEAHYFNPLFVTLIELNVWTDYCCNVLEDASSLDLVTIF